MRYTTSIKRLGALSLAIALTLSLTAALPTPVYAETGAEAQVSATLPAAQTEDDPQYWTEYFKNLDEDTEKSQDCASPSIALFSRRRVAASSNTTAYTSPFTGSSYNVANGSGYLTNGIDVSYYQGTIDWNAVKADGVDFAFIRAGYRSYSESGKLVQDVKLYENLKAAKAAGVKVGVYLYSQAISVEEAQAEAEFVLDLIQSYSLDLPVVIDQEFAEDSTGAFTGRLYTAYNKAGTTAERKEFLTSVANAFCETVEAGGYTPAIYASSAHYNDRLNLDDLEGYIWTAQYGSNNSLQGSYQFWQYSSRGTVAGITSKVDCNFCIDPTFMGDSGISLSQQPTVTSQITITADKYPTGSFQAAAVDLTGTITSAVPLESVTATLKQDGTVVQTVTDTTSVTTYSIANSKLDNGLSFSTLAPGSYTLTYSATDQKGKTETWESPAFTIEDNTPKGSITISPTSYPTGNFTPKSFTLSGTITSTQPLVSVTATLTKDGTVVQTATATTSATSFTIQSSAIDKNMKFAGLTAGSYTLTYTATDKIGTTQTWTSEPFTVGVTGNITISPVAYPTGSFTPKSFTLTGTITSSVALKSITATLTKDGSVVQTATATTSATSFTIKSSTIDKNMKFAGLTAGSYTLTYTATDKNGYTQTWTSPTFTVGSTNTGTTNGTTGNITISPVAYPTGSFTPKSFTLTGTITSSVALKSITATLTKDGSVVQTATATTSATSFTIKSSTIDKNMKFAGLTAGSYTLTYTATDKNGYTQTWTSPTFTVGSTNTGTTNGTTGNITISPVAYPTGSFTPKSFTLTGTITSSVALKSITATLTKDGSVVQTATATTSATSFTIKSSTIDKNMKFAGLTAGSYTLTYTATDKNGYTQTWTSPTFTVGSTGSGTANTGTTTPSSITISPVNYPTGNFTPKSFSLTGTITSTVALKSVSATLYRDGTAVQTTSANTSVKSYTIKNSVLDKNLKFASLSSGTYTLVYSATDANGSTQTWTSPTFTVGSGSSSTSSTITISPASYPTGTIAAKAFSLTGTITSSVALKSVSATIYTESGTVVQTVTATTSSKSYSIKNSTLDNKMKFGSLSKGSYKLVYSATDKNGNTQTWSSPVFTVG
jgi:GH25 family lysozyme M1 (1,4-beta-N-acetylmuramidase)